MRILYCVQNKILEDVLRKNRIINKNSLILRKKKDLTYKKVKEVNPDYIMFPHWSYIVQDKIIDNFKCICFHSSPLPYGRGGSPIQNMILRGFKETEVCSLLMKKELDAGPVYLRSKVKLSGSLDEILLRIYGAVADQIKIFKSKNITPKDQSGEVYKFRRLNLKDNNINFKDSLESIYDQIRMLDSDIYPAAYSKLGHYILDFKNAKLEKDVIKASVEIKRKISLRKVKLSDCREIWKWRNDPQTRSMFINKDFILYDDHLKWFKSKLGNKNCYFYIGEFFGINAGIVRIDLVKGVGDISININPKLRGMSLSETLLNDAIKTFNLEKQNCLLTANINKKNQASIKIFTSLGFKIEKSSKTINTYSLSFD